MAKIEGLDLSKVEEKKFLETAGVFYGKVKAVDMGIAKTGTPFHSFDIVLENCEEGQIKCYIPQDPGKLGFLKSQFRKLNIDVDSPEIDTEDAVGTDVKVNVVEERYEAMDEMGAGTGEFKTAYKMNLLTNDSF